MLINDSQIIFNLRRTAEFGYISLLNKKQLEDLALKYFGVYNDNHELIGYMCPYSGKVYNTNEDIILEHIIPVSSRGGTVLFNCIPASKEVNGLDEKGAKHLIDWWYNSKYWDDNAPKRLENVINYILEGYDKVFRKYTLDELEEAYLDINDVNIEIEQDDDLSVSKREEKKKLRKQIEDNKIYSYLGFLNDCINKLKELGIDTTNINNKLSILEDKNIFKDVDKYTLYQNITRNIIYNLLDGDNKSYLTYSLNIDIKRLINSINLNNKDDIYQEIYSRFSYIDKLLKDNNLSIIDYFKNLQDIEDINILYNNINNVSNEDIISFIESIKLGHDSKINIFIEMLNDNKTIVKDKNGNDKLRCFQILNQKNNEVFAGYPNIKIGQFWRSNNNCQIIIQKLFEGELKDNKKYDVARSVIKEYEFQNNLDLKINTFIEMLNDNKTIVKDKNGNDKLRCFQILNQKNNEVFAGYPNTRIHQFWISNNNCQIIIQKLFEGELKDNKDYDVARSVIKEYGFQTNLNLRINTFVEMLNDNKTIVKDNKGNDILKCFQILKNDNNEMFEGYSNTRIGSFWKRNYIIIIQKLFEGELKDNKDYDVARNTILTYCKVSSIEEYYEKERQKQEDKNDLSGEEIKFQNNLNLRINTFIEMLNDNKTIVKDKNGNDKLRCFQILNQKNNEVFAGYSNTRIGQFWSSNNNSEIIIQKLFEGNLKVNKDYDVARSVVKEFEFQTNLELRINKFIEMLNDNKTIVKDNKGNDILKCFQILKNDNNEMFEGYSNTRIGQFWRSNKNSEIIIQKLFEGELKDNKEYDVARNTILTYCKVNSIEEYYEKERKKKELKELKKLKKDIMDIDKDISINNKKKRA